MATAGLEVRVHEGRERAEATRVARTINEVVASLREIDRIHLLRGTRATWVIADMERAAQDLVMRLEARLVPEGRGKDDVIVPVLALVEGAATLQHEAEVPRLFAPNTVTRLGRLSVPKGGVQSVTLATYNGTTGDQVVLSDAVHANALQAVKPFEVAYGSVDGTLSALRDTRTKGTVKVTVRTTTRAAVEGLVPESLADQLRELWRHRVGLGGKVRRNARGQAIRIDVDTIERLPETNEARPPTAELLGAGKDWLDDLTVDELVRRLRD